MSQNVPEGHKRPQEAKNGNKILKMVQKWSKCHKTFKMLKIHIIQNAQYSKNAKNVYKNLKIFPKIMKKLKMPENTSKCPNPKCSKNAQKI